MPVAVVFPALWAVAPNRIAAAAVATGYFLAASRGIPQGTAEFFGASAWLGLALWIAASLPFVAVHTALWSVRGSWRGARHYGIVMVLTAVPPFGITGWAHPITAAGVLFPGWGWLGLAAMTAVLCAMTTRLAYVVAPMAGVIAVAVAPGGKLSSSEGWLGIDTTVGAALGQPDAIDQQRLLIRRLRDESSNGARVVVLPESALGILTPTLEYLWGEALANLDITVIAGAAVINAQGYDTVMVALDRTGAKILYWERMPVPVAMWQPWQSWFGLKGGAGATFFANPVVEVAGHRVAPLICYEQLLVWPVLQSTFHRPDRIVAIANGWWAKDSSIPAIQLASVEAWARLFDLPLVTAFNH